jgi:hypothetical protein
MPDGKNDTSFPTTNRPQPELVSPAFIVGLSDEKADARHIISEEHRHHHRVVLS